MGSSTPQWAQRGRAFQAPSPAATRWFPPTPGTRASPPDGAFGVDPQARADYFYRSTKLVAKVAQKIIAKYYGRKPAHAYMAGCSTGGRESMLAAQRYPELFDGVVAGDPAFNVVHAAIAEAWFSKKFADIAPKDAQGKPVLQKAFSDADLKLLAGAVLQKCDGLDGLKDRMITIPTPVISTPQV